MIIIPKQNVVEREIEPLAVNTAVAAKLLSVSPRTLDALAKKGLIVKKKIGWRNLFIVESLKRFLESLPKGE